MMRLPRKYAAQRRVTTVRSPRSQRWLRHPNVWKRLSPPWSRWSERRPMAMM
jgi:hypothetical protein